MLTTTRHSPCLIGPKLSNTHYSLSCCLSHNRNITSSSGMMTMLWTMEAPCKVEVGQEVSRFHVDLNPLLLHAGVMNTAESTAYHAPTWPILSLASSNGE